MITCLYGCDSNALFSSFSLSFGEFFLVKISHLAREATEPQIAYNGLVCIKQDEVILSLK